MSFRYLFALVGSAWSVLSAADARAQLVVFVPLRPVPYVSTAVVSTLAGAAGSKGSTDGPGAVARFARPMGLAVAADGTVFVVDEENHTIRKIAPTGEVTTLSGAPTSKGSADGVGAEARIHHPVGVAVDWSGTLYVTDTDNHTIRKITAAGAVTTLAGTAGSKGSADGPGPAARFNLPHGVAVDAQGTVYVTDTFNHTVRKVTADGEVTTLAGTAGRKGGADGRGTTARFNHPFGIAVDAQGTLYVADNGGNTVRKITAGGKVTTLAGVAGQRGAVDGPGATARFRSPTGVALDASGNLYVAEALNATIRKITANGVVTTVAGTAIGLDHADGPGPDARFDGPSGVAVDAEGTVYVADSNSNVIRVVR